MGRVYDSQIKSDVSTIANFGYKPTSATYGGSNPAGIPLKARSITRYGDGVVVRHSRKHGGPEGQHVKGRRTIKQKGKLVHSQNYRGTLLTRQD